MFTESDDMFNADFDVSNKLRFTVRKMSQKHIDSDQSCFLQSARMRAAGVGKDFKENPNLRDNWTDAEGYYSESCPRNQYR